MSPSTSTTEPEHSRTVTVDPPGTTDTLTRPPLTYPGNKAELSDVIAAHMPKHETFVSAFGGTAGVLFNLEKRATRWRDLAERALGRPSS